MSDVDHSGQSSNDINSWPLGNQNPILIFFKINYVVGVPLTVFTMEYKSILLDVQRNDVQLLGRGKGELVVCAFKLILLDHTPLLTRLSKGWLFEEHTCGL